MVASLRWVQRAVARLMWEQEISSCPVYSSCMGSCTLACRVQIVLHYLLRIPKQMSSIVDKRRSLLSSASASGMTTICSLSQLCTFVECVSLMCQSFCVKLITRGHSCWNRLFHFRKTHFLACPRAFQRRYFEDCWCEFFFLQTGCLSRHPTNSVKALKYSGFKPVTVTFWVA